MIFGPSRPMATPPPPTVPAANAGPDTFAPPPWLRNRHVQTLLANKPLRMPAGPPVHDELYELPDGDVVRLVRSMCAAPASTPTSAQARAPTRAPASDAVVPLVVVLHGLAGSYDSAYARDLFAALAAAGLEGHLLHFRGCGGVMNRLPRSYHAADTTDLQHYLQHLQRTHPGRPILAVGYSLGANVLLKYLGESGARSGLSGAVAVSVPFLLDDACRSISTGFARLYHKVLLYRLKASLREKLRQQPEWADAAAVPFDAAALNRVHDLRTFDDVVTAPMHGFDGATHYYAVASCRQYLAGIRVPTLILHAQDDPFQSRAAIPGPEELSTSVELHLTRHGGHVGFVQPGGGAAAWRLDSWLTPRIVAFLEHRRHDAPPPAPSGAAH